jgi:hypothetical protein
MIGSIRTPANVASAAAKIAKGMVTGSIDVDIGQRTITALQVPRPQRTPIQSVTPLYASSSSK